MNVFKLGLYLISFTVLCQPLQAQAMTNAKLGTIIKEQGIVVGIERGLAEGLDVEMILVTSLANADLNSQKILVAMCEAGANVTDIRNASMTQGISPLIFASAMDSCGEDAVADATQAYSAAATRVSAPSRHLGATTPPEPYASPSSF